MTDPDETQQKVLDRADEVQGDYQCPQCGEWWYAKELIRRCFYECGMSFCPNCRKRDSDPVTGETVDICNVCAEKIQEIEDRKRKVVEQANEIAALKTEIGRLKSGKGEKDDVFEIRIPNLQQKEILIVRKAIHDFAKKLLNILTLQRTIKRN